MQNKGVYLIFAMACFLTIVLSGTVKAYDTYAPQIYKVPDPLTNQSAFLKAPQAGCRLGIRTHIGMTVYAPPNSSLTISAWNNTFRLTPDNMADINVIVIAGFSTINISSFNVTIFALTYEITTTTTTQIDQNWQQIMDNTTKGMEEPKIWLWTPQVWVSIAIFALIVSAIFGFGITRITLLVDWLNFFNVIAVGVFALLTLINIIWMATHSGTTAVDSILAFAACILRELILFALLMGWFSGGGFARYTFDLCYLIVVDVKNKVMSMRSGVIYQHNELDHWGKQSTKSALKRVFRNVHMKISYLFGKAFAREGWLFKTELMTRKVFFINKIEEKDDLRVEIDASGKSTHKYTIDIYDAKTGDKVSDTVINGSPNNADIKMENGIAKFKDKSKGKTTKDKFLDLVMPIERNANRKLYRAKVEVRSDMSNLAEMLGCTYMAENMGDYQEHCEKEAENILDYHLLRQENRKLKQQVLTNKNVEVEKFIELGNDQALDIAFGKADAKDAPDLIQEAKDLEKKHEEDRKKLGMNKTPGSGSPIGGNINGEES